MPRLTHERVLDTSVHAQYPGFIMRCAMAGADVVAVRAMIAAMMAADGSGGARHTKGGESTTPLHLRLESRWYASLDSGAPDYSVYDEDDYLAEGWMCWKTYSRGYLCTLRSHVAPVLQMQNVQSIADLGCGIGYTTVGLKQLWPGADVCGTQVAGSRQEAIVARLAAQYRFRCETGGLAKVGPRELVFASEYFEHFYEPVAHLQEVLVHVQPRWLVVANAFNARACGHFPEYLVDGELVPGTTASRKFNNTLRDAGYVAHDLNLWNNRPAVWSRQG